MFNYSYMGLNYPNFYPNKRYCYYHTPRPYFPYSRKFLRNTNFKNENNFTTINHDLNSDKDSNNRANPDTRSESRDNVLSNVNFEEKNNPSFNIESQRNQSNQKNSTNENTSRSTICNESSQKEQAFFSILGLNLYFDDILILCLLFFLYTEEVKDEMLFICLIMLLLS